MASLWYALLAGMLTTYVVLDGFDLGAGALHLFVARTDEERRLVLGAIGPVWDGNEVWLIASGGMLLFTFPRAYAAALSGFYLPLMMVLWLLILRGLSIELRGQLENPLWRAFWDTVFAGSSSAVAVVLGASLGNVLRGVPLDAGGWFHGSLFTNFRIGREPGALDWYTLSVGALALATLAAHGALYLAWKTEGALAERCRRAARRLFLVVALLAISCGAATVLVHPSLPARLIARPLAWPFVLAVPLGIAVALRRRELAGFLGSSAFIIGLLGATAAGVYPVILPSTLDAAWSLTVGNAATRTRSLAIALVWWVPSVALAIVYFIYLFRSFRGKVRQPGHY